MTNPIHSLHIQTSPAEAGIETVCRCWNDSVLQITDDLRALFFTLPDDSPFLKDMLEILARLQIANRHAAESLEELRHGHVMH